MISCLPKLPLWVLPTSFSTLWLDTHSDPALWIQPFFLWVSFHWWPDLSWDTFSAVDVTLGHAKDLEILCSGPIFRFACSLNPLSGRSVILAKQISEAWLPCLPRGSKTQSGSQHPSCKGKQRHQDPAVWKEREILGGGLWKGEGGAANAGKYLILSLLFSIWCNFPMSDGRHSGACTLHLPVLKVSAPVSTDCHSRCFGGEGSCGQAWGMSICDSGVRKVQALKAQTFHSPTPNGFLVWNT